MDLLRFVKKCVTNPPAAAQSAELVLRSLYGKIFWKLNPEKALQWKLPTGGTLYLEEKHSFTHAFWPAVRAYEPEVREFLTAVLKPGETYIDCGSNIGYFSVLAGDLVGIHGRVIAIEANPVTWQLVRRNLSANNLPEPIHCALTTTEGTVDIFAPKLGGDVYSSMRVGGLITESDLDVYRVEGRRLDSLISECNLSRVDVIKIDVEGAEIEVLLSAVQTLKRFRPLCIVEYSVQTWSAFNATREQLAEIAEKAEYRILRIHPTPLCVQPMTAEDWKSGYANLLLSLIEQAIPWVGA